MPTFTLPLASFRAIRLIVHLVYGALLALPLPALNRKLQRRVLKHWCGCLLDILHVRVSANGPINLSELSHGLLVANHISWLDVIALNAISPTRFVAKSEVRHWPLIGWLCAQAQTIFIQRSKRSDTARTNLCMAESLQQGNCMAIFPEGTTTDGTQVHHFHSSLLQPAIDAGVPIYPLALRYLDQHGKPNHDADYIGNMTFVESLWKILSSHHLHAHVITTPPLDTRTTSRRTLATAAHHHICAALSFAQSNSERLSSMPHTLENDLEMSELFQTPYGELLYPAATQPTGNQSFTCL